MVCGQCILQIALYNILSRTYFHISTLGTYSFNGIMTFQDPNIPWFTQQVIILDFRLFLLLLQIMLSSIFSYKCLLLFFYCWIIHCNKLSRQICYLTISMEAWLGRDPLPSFLQLMAAWFSLRLYDWDSCFLTGCWPRDHPQLLEAILKSLPHGALQRPFHTLNLSDVGKVSVSLEGSPN